MGFDGFVNVGGGTSRHVMDTLVCGTEYPRDWRIQFGNGSLGSQVFTFLLVERYFRHLTDIL